MLTEDELVSKIGKQGDRNIYVDPSLSADSTEYHALLKDILSRGMIQFSHDCLERVGIFCVTKKGNRLRLIIDCRRLNYRLKCPAKTKLASSAAFAGVLIQPGERLEYSAHDTQDCLYQFGVPSWGIWP